MKRDDATCTAADPLADATATADRDDDDDDDYLAYLSDARSRRDDLYLDYLADRGRRDDDDDDDGHLCLCEKY